MLRNLRREDRLTERRNKLDNWRSLMARHSSTCSDLSKMLEFPKCRHLQGQQRKYPWGRAIYTMQGRLVCSEVTYFCWCLCGRRRGSCTCFHRHRHCRGGGNPTWIRSQAGPHPQSRPNWPGAPQPWTWHDPITRRWARAAFMLRCFHVIEWAFGCICACFPRYTTIATKRN